MGSSPSVASNTHLKDAEEICVIQRNTKIRQSIDDAKSTEETKNTNHESRTSTSIYSNPSDPPEVNILSESTLVDSDADSYTDSDSEMEQVVTDTEDFNTFKLETFGRLKKSADCLRDAYTEIAKNKDSKSKMIQQLKLIDELYFDAQRKGFERELYEQYEKKFCKQLLQLDVLSICINILDEMPKDFNNMPEENEQNTIMILILGILHSCTDISDEFAITVADTKVIEMNKSILDVKHNKNFETDSKIIYSCHGIVHNVSMREKNVARLRSLDFTTTLAPYLESQDAIIRISALATLANIVTEKECSIIGNHILVVAQLLMLLKEGMKTESRRCNGWSCKECILAIRQLARNDANKKLLHELKILQSLVELAESEDKEEQIESILAILALSFDDEIRADMTRISELGVVDVLLDLKESSDDPNLKSNCEKILWNLMDDLLLSEIPLYKETGLQMQSEKVKDTKTRHIMISYQRNDRKFLLTIRDKLISNGFQVWMDVGNMRGCVYQTMAEAVENSNIFLMCYSRKYKESDNCQYEAKYAHKRNTTVIPLKMERDYDPDGWLGLLLKSDYFLDFSGKYSTEDKFKELLDQIKLYWSNGQDKANKPVVVKSQQPVLAKAIDEVDSPPKPEFRTKERKEFHSYARINIVKGWDQEHVNKWLERNNLKNQGIDKITGLEISLMGRMLLEVPEQLYECLRQDLKIKSLSTKARIVWALDDLVYKDE